MGACLLTGTVGTLHAEPASQQAIPPPSSQLFNHVAVTYAYRAFTGGLDGDGRAHGVDLAVSKEWLIRSNGVAVIGFQLAPTLGFMAGEYELVSATSHTIDAGARLGVLVHDPKRLMTVALFTDTSWNIDSIEGRPRESGLLLKPGVEITFRLDSRWACLRALGFQVGYRYAGLTAHDIEINGERVDFRRADNSLDNEVRYGLIWDPKPADDGQARAFSISAGVLQYFGTAQGERSSVGAFLSLKKSF